MFGPIGDAVVHNSLNYIIAAEFAMPEHIDYIIEITDLVSIEKQECFEFENSLERCDTQCPDLLAFVISENFTLIDIA